MPDPRRDPTATEVPATTTGVLVVDDEDGFRHGLVRRLETVGYRCHEAVDAWTAREVLEARAHEVDVVLCDIEMPGESGLDLLRSLVADHPALAVVMTTGITDPATAALAVEIGADGYLVKPFE